MPIEENLKLTKESGGKKVVATQCKSLIERVKKILCYINDTLTNEFFGANNNDVKFVGYTDSDWAKNVETRK
ncbi:hypothetical protein CR513_44619, partial [Mucuna pruriens]